MRLCKHHTATHVVLLKVLTFACAQVKKSTMGEASCNCKACWDRIAQEQLNIYTRRQNVEQILLCTCLLCIQKIRQHAKMSAGVSEQTYAGKNEDCPRMGGEI